LALLIMKKINSWFRPWLQHLSTGVARPAAGALRSDVAMDGSPPEIAIEPSLPDAAMASPPDPSSSTPDAAMEGQGATACSLAASALAASGLGTPAVGLGDGGCCAPAAGLAEPAVGLAMPVDECCSAPAAGLAARVDECLAPPDASAIALARTLLPTTPLQAVEYNLPVLEVQR